MTTNTELRDLLVRARERIEQGWTKGANARDSYGEEISSDSPAACQWCAQGAIMAEGVERCLELSAVCCLDHELSNVASEWSWVASWSDEPERTKADVLALYDRAIEGLK